jgi:hypothetical protein
MPDPAQKWVKTGFYFKTVTLYQTSAFAGQTWWTSTRSGSWERGGGTTTVKVLFGLAVEDGEMSREFYVDVLLCAWAMRLRAHADKVEELKSSTVAPDPRSWGRLTLHYWGVVPYLRMWGLVWE